LASDYSKTAFRFWSLRHQEARMTALTLFLAKLIGATLIVIGLALALRDKRQMLEMVDRIMRDPGMIFIAGAVRLIGGLAIVIGHEDWSNSLAIVVSLLGWIMFLSGLTLLFTPPQKLVALYESMGFERHYASYAGGPILVGLALVIAASLG
jgi:hypothetical protein